MCVRDFQNLTLCRPKLRQNFGPFVDKWGKSFENIHPKTLENEFLAVYFASLKKFRKNLLFDQRKL